MWFRNELSSLAEVSLYTNYIFKVDYIIYVYSVAKCSSGSLLFVIAVK